MTLFELNSGVIVNTSYIVIIGKIAYNNTSGKYYFILVLSNMESNLNLDFDSEELANKERNRLISVMRGE